MGKDLVMEDDEIKELATDVFKDKVFFSTMLQEHEMHLLSSVFLPITFMDEPQIEQIKKDNVAAFYEYYDKAGPRAINGLPMFTSMRTITEEDLKKMGGVLVKLKEAVDNA